MTGLAEILAVLGAAALFGLFGLVGLAGRGHGDCSHGCSAERPGETGGMGACGACPHRSARKESEDA